MLVIGSPFLWWMRVDELRAVLAPVVAGTGPSAHPDIAAARRFVRGLDAAVAVATTPGRGPVVGTVLRGAGWTARLLLRGCRVHAAEMERGVAAAAARHAQAVDYGLRIVAQEQVGLAYAGWDRLLTRVALPAWRMGRWPSRLDAGVVAALTELSRRDRLAEGFASRLGERPACDLLEEPGSVDEAASLLAARLFHGGPAKPGPDWAPVDWQAYPAEIVDRKWRIDAARLHRVLDSLGIRQPAGAAVTSGADGRAGAGDGAAADAGHGAASASASAALGRATDPFPFGSGSGSGAGSGSGSSLARVLEHLTAPPGHAISDAGAAGAAGVEDAVGGAASHTEEPTVTTKKPAPETAPPTAPTAPSDPFPAPTTSPTPPALATRTTPATQTAPAAPPTPAAALAAGLSAELAREEAVRQEQEQRAGQTAGAGGRRPEDALWDDGMLPLFPMQPPRTGRELLADHVTAMVCCAAVDTAGAAPGLDWLDGPSLLVDGERAADLGPHVLTLIEDGDPEPLRGWLTRIGVRPEKPVRLV